uniref:procollagen C-endopeptidase enhancer 2-like n=1 Tax=Styela clava TaxID=7725 RepID=UPI00193A08A1|nr:procollagen C-endopeptidase enhancer 2-like [Styela clava]
MYYIRAASVISFCILLSVRVNAQDEYTSVFQECNQTIREGQGVIMSPDFTTVYPNNLHCEWNIEVEEDRIVTFTFGYFDVEKSLNCKFDRVSIYNGPTVDHPMLGKFCGPFRPGQQISTSNKMLISMDSDASTGRKGFYGYFVSAVPELATEGSCGGLLKGAEGSFHSPNYPKSNYPGPVTCSWHIRVDEDKIVLMSIDDFDIEKSIGCKYDALVIYGGWSHSEKTKFIGRFCGGSDDIPSRITSPGNELFVTFVSDTSGFATGFSASYGAKKRLKSNTETRTTTTTSSTTTVSTTSTMKPTTTPIITTTSAAFECPVSCPPKIKTKARICSANYLVVVRLNDNTLRTQNIATIDLIKPFKQGSLPSVSSTQIRIACRRCSKIFKKGSYVIAGDTITDEGIEIRPEDLVIKHKQRKHTKQIPKLLKKCRKTKRRKGKRSSPQKRGKRTKENKQ